MIFGERIRAGLVGIPSSGKTTIFNLLTRSSAEVAPYPFTTKDKNHGVMIMFDDIVERIAKVMKSSEIKYPALEIVDVAGLVRGAHKGEGLGNEFLSYIRPLDIVIYVLRYLKSVPHIEGADDIKRDFETLRYEIAMKDIEILSRAEEKLKKPAISGNKEAKVKIEIIQKMKKAVDDFFKYGKFSLDLTSEESKVDLKDLEIICSKPWFVILNTDVARDRWSELVSGISVPKVLVCDAQMELEFEESDLLQEGIVPLRHHITDAVLSVANVIVYYTGFEGKELRSWVAQSGISVYEAAGYIHSDIQKGFISADVASAYEYIKYPSDSEAYKNGVFRTVGRDYKLNHRDIVRIKFK